MEGTPVRPVRLLIVDDEASVRRGLAIRFSTEPDLVVVGEAADGRAGIDRARELAPDLVLMDAAMPQLDGLAALHRLRRLCPTTPVVILSLFDDAASRAAAFTAGAAAFVSKHDGDAVLLDTLRAVARRSP